MYNNNHANYSKNITINKKTTLKLYNKVYYTFFFAFDKCQNTDTFCCTHPSR